MLGFTENNIDGVVFYSCDAFAAEGVKTAFTTRLGGISRGEFSSLNLGFGRGDDRENVLENYRRLGAAVGFAPERAVACRQVHGTDVRMVSPDDRGLNILRRSDGSFDGAATDLPGTALLAFTADCMPALLLDRKNRAVAALHAGWRGTAGGILTHAVGRMAERFGTRAGDLLAALGPCISRCCFETGGDVPAAMRRALGGAAEDFIVRAGDKWKVDLKGINAARLVGCGVLKENIFVHPHCTVCEGDLYWSHRATGGKRGSQAAVIAL